MKHLVCLCCALCVCFFLFGCEKSETVPLPAFEEAGFEQTARDWQARAEAFINAEKIESVTFGVYHVGEPDLYTSDDPEIIERWKRLVANMRLTAVPFEMYYGGAQGVTYRCNGEDIALFGAFSYHFGIPINLGNADSDLPSAALRIDNRNEVEGEYLALQRAMGVEQ